MRTNPLIAIREIPKHRGSLIILASVLIGLVLARFVMISPIAGIMVLSSGIVFTLTILLRKIDYLIFAWFVLTSVIWLIMVRLLPPHYYPFVGRGIFWGLLVCIIAAWAIDNILSGRRFTPFHNVPLKTTVLIFLLWCTLTLFTSLDVLNSVKKLSHIVIALATSYMFYDFFSRDQNNIKKVLGVLFFVVIVISFIAIVVSGHALISGSSIYKRISLWFFNPNVLGSLLFLCMPILVTAGPHFVSNRGLKIFFVSIMLLALFFSFHRTSWLATLVSIVFLLWKGRMKMPIWVAIVIGLIIAALLFPVMGEDLYDYVTGERYSGRIEIWQAAWNTACDYPLLGTGPGNVVEIMSRYIDTPWLKGQDTHSLYLKNLVEMGFMSMVIWLVFYFTLFKSMWRIEKNLTSDYLKLVTRGAMAAFLGVLIHGIFENGSFFTPFDAAEFHVMLPYILMALPFAAKRLEERERLGR